MIMQMRADGWRYQHELTPEERRQRRGPSKPYRPDMTSANENWKKIGEARKRGDKDVKVGSLVITFGSGRKAA